MDSKQSVSESSENLNNAFNFLKGEFKDYKKKFKELDGWELVIGRAKRALGTTKYKSKVIEISKYSLNMGREKNLNTLRHEIAHVIAGRKNKHNKVWKRVAKNLGCDGKRCSSIGMDVQHKYELKCRKCKWVSKYHRRPKISNKICKTCNQGVQLFKVNFVKV